MLMDIQLNSLSTNTDTANSKIFKIAKFTSFTKVFFIVFKIELYQKEQFFELVYFYINPSIYHHFNYLRFLEKGTLNYFIPQ